MVLFYTLTAGLALVVAAMLALALLRGRRDGGPAEAFDIEVYRAQLKEIDRDLARGIIPEDEAERLRTEVSRRILAADAKARAAGADTGTRGQAGAAVAGLIAAVLLGGGYGLYAQLGAPGYGDLPRQMRIANAAAALTDRPAQAEAEATVPPTPPLDVPEEYLDLVTRLRGTLAERPDDLRGLALLARSEAALGNYAAAWAAQARIVELKGDGASAREYADLADMMVLAAGGYVSPEAQAALEAALARDPANGVARYYGGLMMAQTGRPDIAFRMWDRLLRESPADAPWMPPIREQIAEMAWRAGVSDYQLPEAPAPRGPSAADVAAAQDMTPEERAEMIRGMVRGLSDRLANEGGPPQDWARLINALGVLGDTTQAAAIWAEAQTVFAAAPDALAQIRAAAEAAGVAN